MELDILLLLALLGISATGPGKLSLKQHVCVCQKKVGAAGAEKEGCCGGTGNCGGECGCKK